MPLPIPMRSLLLTLFLILRKSQISQLIPARPTPIITRSSMWGVSSESIPWLRIHSGMDHCLCCAMWGQMVLRWWQSVWGEILLGGKLSDFWWCPTLGSFVQRMSLVGKLGGVVSFEGTPWQTCLRFSPGELNLLIVFLILDPFFLFHSFLKILKVFMRMILRTLRSPLLLHTCLVFSPSSPFQAFINTKWTLFIFFT